MTPPRTEPLRILHVLPHLIGGGAERQVSYLAARQAEEGMEVHIACRRSSRSPAEADFGGTTVHRLRAFSNHDPGLLVRLFALARRIRPCIIQTCILQMDILGGTVATTLRIPWVIRESSSAECYPSGWKTTLRQRLGARAAAVVANSAGGVEYWARGLPDGRVHLVGNGLPVDAITAAPAFPDSLPFAAGTAVHPRDLLFAGRLSPEKRIDRLVTAVARIPAGRQPRLLLCGDGPAGAELLQLARTKGIGERVIALGPLPPARLWSLMKSCHAFVSLSRFEGFPNAAAEAMVCGCPLVLSDIPAHRSLASDTALFADPDDASDLDRALADVLDDGEVSRRERAGRVRAARERAAVWTIPRLEVGYRELYKSILSMEEARQRNAADSRTGTCAGS